MAAGIKKGESATAPAQFSHGVLGHWRIASLARTYRFFSADSHFESAPDRWVHRVPKQYRDRAPRRVKLPSGKDIIVEEGCGITFRGTNQFAGKTLEEFRPVGLDFDNAIGAGASEQRLKKQDVHGTRGKLIFPSQTRMMRLTYR